MAKKTTQPTMNEAFTELEAIVAEFEEGSLDLEKSLPKFKKGLELTKFLKQRLKKLENDIVEIKEEFEEEDLDFENKGIKEYENEDQGELPF